MKKMTKAMLMTALILGSVQFGNATVYASEIQEFASRYSYRRLYD